MIGAPSIFKLTRRVAVLTKLLPIFALSCPRKAACLSCLLSGRFHGSIAQAELLKLQKSGQFPDEPVRIVI